MSTLSPRRNRIAAQVPSRRTARADAAASRRAVPAPRPAAQEEHSRDISLLPGRDTAANAATPAVAADTEARTPAGRIEWDFSELDPEDLEHPWTEWQGPEYPGPSWLGLIRRGGPTYVLAVAPWYLERYGDKAWDITQVLQLGKEHHRDPEPDLEAEP